MKLCKKLLNKIKYYYNYFIANTLMKSKIDADNDCFNIMSDKSLVDEIVDNHKSFARIGDGELSLMLDKNFNISFQENSLSLSKRLKEVLNSNVDNLILGINRGFTNPKEYSKRVQKYFRTFNYLYRNT